MSLAINFQMADDATEAIKNLGAEDTKLRAVAVALDDEKVVLAKTVEATSDLAADCNAIRDALTLARTPAAIVFVKCPANEFYQVVVIPSDAKPKVRLSHASASSHLRSNVGLKIAKECHVDKGADIVASLFEKPKEEERTSMMTESEKVNAETNRQVEAERQTLPTAVALPGMATPLSQDAKDAVVQFKDGAVDAVFIDMAPAGLDVIEKLDKGATVGEMSAKLRSETPKFMLGRFGEEKIGLVYLCPPECKPKVKMVYATSKTSLTKQLREQFEGIKVIDVEQAATLDAKVSSAFA